MLWMWWCSNLPGRTYADSLVLMSNLIVPGLENGEYVRRLKTFLHGPVQRIRNIVPSVCLGVEPRYHFHTE